MRHEAYNQSWQKVANEFSTGKVVPQQSLSNTACVACAPIVVTIADVVPGKPRNCIHYLGVVGPSHNLYIRRVYAASGLKVICAAMSDAHHHCMQLKQSFTACSCFNSNHTAHDFLSNRRHSEHFYTGTGALVTCFSTDEPFVYSKVLNMTDPTLISSKSLIGLFPTSTILSLTFLARL